MSFAHMRFYISRLPAGTPLAAPWQACVPSRLQHGFARNLDWAIVSTSADANPDDPEPMLELLLTDNEYTRKMWPYEFAAVYQVRLSPAVSTKLYPGVRCMLR